MFVNQTAGDYTPTGTGNNERKDMPPPASIDQRDVQIPLPSNEWATLRASFPINEGAWAQMLVVLNAMKPGLVKETPGPPTKASGDKNGVSQLHKIG